MKLVMVVEVNFVSLFLLMVRGNDTSIVCIHVSVMNAVLQIARTYVTDDLPNERPNMFPTGLRLPAPCILAIDPGLTTGVAILDGELGVTTLQLQPEELYEFVTKFDLESLDAIVCEAYMISPDTLRKSRQLWSLELIGVMRYRAWQTGVPFKLQQASSAKKFVTNDRLKAYGLYKPGQDHANDALRHMCIYLVERGKLEVSEI